MSGLDNSLENVNQYNRSVKGWGQDTNRKVRNRVLRLCVAQNGPGTNITMSTKQYFGEVNKVGFKFPYYMIFVHKGAGRGYGGGQTGLFTRANGGKGSPDKNSFGKMGTGKRVAKPWFNPVIAEEFPALQEIVIDYRNAQVVLNIQRILID